MKLDPEQTQQLINKLSSKMTIPCGVCGAQDWSVSDILSCLPEFNPVGMTSQAVAPLVVIYCQNCAHVFLFSAIHLGVIDRQTGKWVNE
jgi:hypothetical protein